MYLKKRCSVYLWILKFRIRNTISRDFEMLWNEKVLLLDRYNFKFNNCKFQNWLNIEI